MENDYKMLAGKKVLVVDDVYMNQLLMGKVLDKHSMKYEFAMNGLQALDKLEGNYYDIVLMDLQMPVMDGFEAIKRIRADLNQPAEKLPIIGISASIFNEELRRCIDMGANDFLSKPYEPDELFKKMISLMHLELPQKPETNIEKPVKDDDEAAGTALIDMTYLEQLAAGDKAFIAEMIQFFIDTAPTTLHDLKMALSSSDLATVYQVAHKFAPQLNFMGIGKAIPDVEEIEKIAKAGTNDGSLDDRVKRVDEITNNAINELKKYLDQ